MRVVFADPRPRQIREALIENHVQHYLASYFYKESIEGMLATAQAISLPTCIIDSGAFSAWNSGKAIRVEQYAQFIHEFATTHRHRFSELYFVNLDVIPGKKGGPINKEDGEWAAHQGWQNYEYLRAHTHEYIIPVFHQGEQISWLEQMLKTGADYIGISPSNDETTTGRDPWCEYVFKFVPAHIRIHGFAVTSPYLMFAYPWFSVDSITYKVSAGYGNFWLYRPSHPFTPLRYAYSEEKDSLPRSTHYRQALEQQLLALDPRFTLAAVKHSKNYFRTRLNIKTLLLMETQMNQRGSANRHLQQPLLL